MKIISKSKNSINFLSLIFSLLILFALQNNGYSQQCVACEGTTTSGLYPSAIGRYTTATGNYSFAGGIYSVAEGQSSFAFGNRAKALGGSSIAFGQFINITASTAIGIGFGFDISNPLVNNVPRTFMIGIGSTKPTFFVGESSGVNSTGRIGIGNVTSPQAKLHIRADEDEDASLLLEPSEPRKFMAKLQLLDANSGLTASTKSGLELFTDLGSMQFMAGIFEFTGKQVNMPTLRINNAYSLPVTVGKPGEFLNSNGLWEKPEGGGGDSYWMPSGTSNIYFGSAVGIGMEPVEKLSLDSPWGRPIHFHLGGSQGISSNAYYDGTASRISEDGPAYQIGFSSINMSFKAALPSVAGATVNWNEAMVITQQGNVGIGTIDTKGYKLAVKGNLIAEEVVIKLGSQWPDFVFEDNYKLMPHAELEQFIQSNKHLPGIPDAQEVVEEGVSIGEMNALLLQKIEELTLYMLQQQKEIEMLKQRLGN